MKVTKTYLKVPVEIYEESIEGKTVYSAQVADKVLDLGVSQGDSVEEAKENLYSLITEVIEYYQSMTTKAIMIADHAWEFEEIYIYPQHLGQDIDELAKDKEFREKYCWSNYYPGNSELFIEQT